MMVHSAKHKRCFCSYLWKKKKLSWRRNGWHWRMGMRWAKIKWGNEEPAAPRCARRERKMRMINDASFNWMRKYGFCLGCTAEETQRRRYTSLMLTQRRGSELTAKQRSSGDLFLRSHRSHLLLCAQRTSNAHIFPLVTLSVNSLNSPAFDSFV